MGYSIFIHQPMVSHKRNNQFVLGFQISCELSNYIAAPPPLQMLLEDIGPLLNFHSQLYEVLKTIDWTSRCMNEIDKSKKETTEQSKKDGRHKIYCAAIIWIFVADSSKMKQCTKEVQTILHSTKFKKIRGQTTHTFRFRQPLKSQHLVWVDQLSFSTILTNNQ